MKTRAGALMRSNRDRLKREKFRRELLTTGNLLVDALELERHFTRHYTRNPTADRIAELDTCRRTVRQLVQDYKHSVARYRRAVKASFSRQAASKR